MRNALVLLLLVATPALCVEAEARFDPGPARMAGRVRADGSRAAGRAAGAEGAVADVGARVAAEAGRAAGAGAADASGVAAAADVPAAVEPPTPTRQADRGVLVRASLGSAAYAGIALVWIVGVGVALRRGRRAGPRRSD